MKRNPILRDPNFQLLGSTRFLLELAQQIQSLAVGWQVYALTRDPLYLGLIGLTEALPSISIALYAGHIVDNRDPKRVYQLSCAALFLGSVCLCLISAPLLGLPMHWKLIGLFSVIFGSGLARGFISPAHFILVSTSLPRKTISEWMPWLASAWQVASILGPAVGGGLYLFVGPSGSYGLVAILTVGAALCCRGVRPSLQEERLAKKESLLASLGEGLRFVFSTQVILAALSLDMFAVFFGGATSVLPIFVDKILHAGPVALGVLRTAPAVGAVIMTLFLVRFPLRRQIGRWLLISVAGYGMCMVGFGLSTSLAVGISLLILAGALDYVSVSIRSTILQLMAPARMRGRVSAVNSIFIGSSNELGEFESGVAAKLLGLSPSIVFGGSITLLVVSVIALVAPQLRQLDLALLVAEE